jgi:hypothetical protein
MTRARARAAVQLKMWAKADKRQSLAELMLRLVLKEYQGLCLEEMQRPLDSGGEARKYFSCVDSLPYDARFLSCVALWLCVRHCRSLSPSVSREIEKCRVHGEEAGGLDWLETLPWEIAARCLKRARDKVLLDSGDLHTLTGNLAHHNSTLRLYLSQYGWIAREWLPREKATERLLKNAADTLTWWEESLGLCAALYPREEDFWKAADDFQCDDTRFREQYADRLRWAREAGVSHLQSLFFGLEEGIRTFLLDRCLPLELEEAVVFPRAVFTKEEAKP